MERPALQQPRLRHLGLKVGVVLTLIPLVAIGLLLYSLHARGVFDRTQALTLIAADADGVVVGMPIMFSGFPIGQVSGMALDEQGRVRIDARIREKDARWLRISTVFSLEKQILGGAKIRAITSKMQDEPLPAGSERPLVSKDAAQDLPQVIARANAILQNIDEIVRPDSSFNQTLANMKSVTARMTGEYGVLGGVTGSPEQAKKVLDTVDVVNALLTSLKGVTARADGVLAKTDESMFSRGGVMDEARRSIGQLNAVLADARESLKKADELLATAQAGTADMKQAASNVKDATTDLGALRSEINDRIRKVNDLIDEINRKWPFARKTEIKLP
ncbi:MAG TPA: MlaD family protein [Burkholderiales bacterium]|nr:MlaD family protein [Burkholderiales bacterium]